MGPGKDRMMGLPFKTGEAVWDTVKILQLETFRTSKAYHGLGELRLVKVGFISHSRLRSILLSSPRLRVFELNLEVQGYTIGDDSITAVRLENLEIVILGGVKHEQLGSVLQLIAPGSNPLSLSLVNPYLGSSEFTSKEELARFVARSNLTRLCVHSCDTYSQLAEVLSLMPDVRTVALNDLSSGAIEAVFIPLEYTIDVLYVINCCSQFSRFSWAQLEIFVKEHHVQKLVLWLYDFRYCGLSEIEAETIPDNLFTICPVVQVIPDTDPNPIVDWFGD